MVEKEKAEKEGSVGEVADSRREWGAESRREQKRVEEESKREWRRREWRRRSRRDWTGVETKEQKRVEESGDEGTESRGDRRD
jgi:hypothetical protein